jgi:hypothetical protein
VTQSTVDRSRVVTLIDRLMDNLVSIHDETGNSCCISTMDG